MRVATLSYRRNRNLGNYESEHIELQVELEPDETPGEALRRAKLFVAAAFGERPLNEEEQRRAAALEL